MRLPPCPGVLGLEVPGPQPPRLLGAPLGRPTGRKGHARILLRPPDLADGYSPGSPRSQVSREGVSGRQSPNNRHFLTFCGRERQKCQPQGKGQSRWAGAGRQAARPPTTGHLPETRTTSGKTQGRQDSPLWQPVRWTIDFEPNTNRFRDAGIIQALRENPAPCPDSGRRKMNERTLISHNCVLQ